MSGRISQAPAEILLTDSERLARATQVILEVLVQELPPVQARITQSPVEVLLDAETRLSRATQLAIEVLVQEVIPPPAACINVVIEPYGIQIAYFIKLKNQEGQVVAIFDNFLSMHVKHELNGVGTYELIFADDGDERFELFELDGQIELYRMVIGRSTWTLEFEGLHRKPVRSIAENGEKIFSSIGLDYNDLLSRPSILYKEGTIRADKNAPAEIVIKEYVEENCGPTGLQWTVVGRLFSGSYPGFIVEAPSPQANLTANWAGSRAFENLLDSLQDIANYAGIDFKVIGNGPAQFIFMTRIGQLGYDLTTIDLDATTGLNVAGNRPIIFAVSNGTVQNLEYVDDHLAEITVVSILGKGEMSTRHTITVYEPNRLIDSPWNRREVTRSAGNDQEFEYQMVQLGNEVLIEGSPDNSYIFKPMQVPVLLYGIDYKTGDKVTLRSDKGEFHKKIVSVDVTIAETKEEVSITFGEF